jgi:hypothetical protein
MGAVHSSLPLAAAERPIDRKLVPAIAALLFACVAASGARAQGPCTDVTTPELAITSPARAAAIEQGGIGDDVVVVSGVAEDSESPLVSLVVDGQELIVEPISGPQPFAVPTTSRWGLSVVTASAEDACGNRSERVQSFLRSGSYQPSVPATPALATVGDALVIRVGQELLDDRDSSDPDDFATLADAALKGVDWNAVVPQLLASDPLRSCGCTCSNPGACLGVCCPADLHCPTFTDIGYTVSRGSLSASNLRVTELTSSDTGIQGRVDLASLQTQLSATVRSTTCVLGIGGSLGPATVSGSVTGSNASATGVFVPSTVGGELGVQVLDASVNLGTLDVSLDCGAVQFVCDAVDAISNAVLDRLEGALEDLLESTFEEVLATLLRELLDDFQLPPIVELPPPLAVTIDAESRIDDVSTSASGIALGLAARLSPRALGAGIPPDARGAIRRDGVPPAEPAAGLALGIAAKDDLVNQLFWAVWSGGGLDLPDLRAEALRAGYPVESLSLEVHLPPVMRSGETPGEVEIGVGDAFVELTVDLAQVLGPSASGLLDIEFWFSAFLDGHLDVLPPERLTFEVGGVRAESEIVAASNPVLAEILRPFLDELLAVVAQRLVDAALDGLRIPTVDVAANVPATGVPAGTVLGLGGNSFADRPNDDYTRMAGDVALYIPEPGALATAFAAVAALGAIGAGRRRRWA